MLGFQTPEQRCEICGSGDDEEHMLLCDGCNGGFHLECLDPPMTEIPKQREWFCDDCTTAALGTSIASPNRPLVYEVGSILKKRSTLEDGVQYLIRWKVRCDLGICSHREAFRTSHLATCFFAAPPFPPFSPPFPS